MRNKILISILTLLLSGILTATAQLTTPRYGFAPEQCDSTLRKWQGVGENGFIAGAICLDPITDPAVARLRGHKIVGVRCYLNHAYEQSRQKRSLIFHSSVDLNETQTQKICDFTEGWNNIYFDQPVTIGDDAIYVGLQVYETIAMSHPLGAYDPVSVEGGCWINLKKEGWKSYTDRGTLMIYALLDDEAAPLLDNAVLAQTANAPLIIEPSKDFDGEVSFHNCGTTPISSLTLEMLGEGDTAPTVQNITFDTPLQAYEGRVLPLQVHVGSKVGTNQWLELTVTEVNGSEAQAVRPGLTWHYVTNDAFTRTPLVEEFTSQRCVNCPFMAYFLDIAIEEHTLSDIAYVAHHAGYLNDAFTQPVDEALCFLFGPGSSSYNPAVMYDRIVPVGQEVPVVSAKVAEVEPYADALRQAALRPAMASVNITAEGGTDGISCHVSGRVNSEMASSGIPLYLSVYLVEDSITTDQYPQLGLEEDPDAPADLQERFRHNGVIRYNYCTVSTGDQLALNADNTYSVDFPAAEVAATWNLSNCRIVAFVHQFSKDMIRVNQVLNAANLSIAKTTGINAATTTGTMPRAFVGTDRRISISDPLTKFSVYNMEGRRQNPAQALTPGVYLVRMGHTTQKVIVR